MLQMFPQNFICSQIQCLFKNPLTNMFSMLKMYGLLLSINRCWKFEWCHAGAQEQLILITPLAVGYVKHLNNLGRVVLAGRWNCIFLFKISSDYLQLLQTHRVSVRHVQRHLLWKNYYHNKILIFLYEILISSGRALLHIMKTFTG